MKRPALGSGARFKALTAQLSNKPGIRNPAAVAASAGRSKYGTPKMSAMAQHGKMK